MKLRTLNIAILSVTCAGITGAALAADNSYRSYPMMYMTKPDTDEKTFNVVGLVEPTFTTSTSNKVRNKTTGLLGKQDVQNNFTFDRLRFGFNGSYSKNLDYFFMSEWARNAITKPSAGAGQAFIAHATFKNVVGSTNMAVGSMAIPMGLSYYAPTTQVPWITYADIEYNLYGSGSINGAADITTGAATTNHASNIWKPGIMLFDQYNLDNGASLTYTAGLYNTTGTNFSDNSTSQKDFNGTLEYKQGKLLAMYGTRIGSTTESNPVNSYSERSRLRHAVTLTYNDFKKDKWWLWGEYMHATDEMAKGAKDITADGFFVAAGFRVTPKIEFVARHSQFDRNKDSNDHTRTVNSVIMNYKRDDGIRIQAQYNAASEDNWANTAGTVYPNDTFTMRFSVPIFAKLK